MGTEQVDDGARWAEAQSLLARTPTESAARRLRRWQRLFLLTAVVLVTATGTAVLLIVFRGSFPASPSHAPTGQVVTGFVLAGAGLVLQFCGVVALVLANRRLRGWSSPLSALTRAQLGELRAQVTGHRPVDEARVPLARMLAEQSVAQRTAPVSNAGQASLLAGLWIASPAHWRAVLAAAFALLIAVGWPFVQRDVRRARRFLAEHPPAGA